MSKNNHAIKKSSSRLLTREKVACSPQTSCKQNIMGSVHEADQILMNGGETLNRNKTMTRGVGVGGDCCYGTYKCLSAREISKLPLLTGPVSERSAFLQTYL